MADDMQKHHASFRCDGPTTTHRIGMAVGDLLFLAVVGAATLAAMHAAHMVEWKGWGFVGEMAIGMAGAMIVQVALAWLATPLLGSIETMVPSMLLAMVAPMSLCLLHGTGCVLTWSDALGLGAAAGVAAAALLAIYGASCRRWALTAGGRGGGGRARGPAGGRRP
ncbi:MAG: hypothetical protein K2X32_00275 [Phycisphaerales bacterium]|nr:hypothetical protein [Phycisphaerales bacterium]